MNSIEQSGFLSETISEWIKKHRSDNFEYFKFCEDINDFSHRTMFTMTIHNKVLVELIVASLYVRTMSNFQATIILAERGMVNEAKSLLRCMLESMFAIVAIEKDKNIVSQFVLEDLCQRKNYLKAHKRNRDAGVEQSEDAPSEENLEKMLAEIEEDIKKHDVKKLSIRDLAEKASQISMYDSAYKLLSGSIHVNARDLEQYLELNESGDVKKILWGPDVREIDVTLFTAAETMLTVLTSISRIFDLTYEEPWSKFVKTHQKLGEEINNLE